MRARRGAIGVQSSTGANRGAGWIGHYLAYKAASRRRRLKRKGGGGRGGRMCVQSALLRRPRDSS